jgi:hypothetical protein
MEREGVSFTLLRLGALGLLVASSATGASEVRKPAPRVGFGGTIGPVFGRHDGDGTLRFIRLGQHCKKNEKFFYLHVRFKGQAGPAGPSGAQGLQGLQGLRGLQGEIEATGPAGLRGLDGDVGPMWPAGEQSPAGSQGEQGAQGETGAAGAPGRTG